MSASDRAIWITETSTLHRSTRLRVLDQCLTFLESNRSEAKIEEIEAQPNLDPAELKSQLETRRHIESLNARLGPSIPLLHELSESYSSLPSTFSTSKTSSLFASFLSSLTSLENANSAEVQRLTHLLERRESDLTILTLLRNYFDLLKNRVLRDLRVMSKRILEGKLTSRHVNQLGKAKGALRYAFREVNRRRQELAAAGVGAGDAKQRQILDCVRDVRIREVHEIVDLSLKTITETISMEYLLGKMNVRIPIIVREMRNLRRLDRSLAVFVEKAVLGEDSPLESSPSSEISRKKAQMKRILTEFFPANDDELRLMMERFEILFFPLREVKFQPVSVDDLLRFRELVVDRERADGKIDQFDQAIKRLRKMTKELYNKRMSELPAARLRVQQSLKDAQGLALEVDDPDLGSAAVAARYRALKRTFDALAAVCHKRIAICLKMEGCWKLHREQLAIGHQLKLRFISNRTNIDDSLEDEMVEKAATIENLLDEIMMAAGSLDDTELGETYTRISADYLSVYGRLKKIKQTPRGRRVPYCWFFGQMRFVPDTQQRVRHGVGKEFYPAGKLKFYGRYEHNRRKGQGELYATDGVTVLQQGEWDGMTVVALDVNLQDFEMDVSSLMQKVRYPDDRLGGGGFGQVYRSTTETGSVVAIKVIELNRQDMQEFVNEVRILCGLKHENVIQFIGFSKSPCAYVMEYCEKGSVSHLIHALNRQEEKVSFQRKTQIVYEAAQGMHYLHSKHIFHRDLKWENVLIAEDDTVRIIDFGLSKTVETFRVSKAAHTMELGTSWYIAPEVMNRNVRGNYTKKCDVYSFGIMMYELLYQTLKPYAALVKGEMTVPTMLALAVRISENADFRPPIRPRDLNSDRYGWYLRICKHAWQHDPAQRWTFRQILAEFDRWRKRESTRRRVVKKSPASQ